MAIDSFDLINHQNNDVKIQDIFKSTLGEDKALYSKIVYDVWPVNICNADFITLDDLSNRGFPSTKNKKMDQSIFLSMEIKYMPISKIALHVYQEHRLSISDKSMLEAIYSITREYLLYWKNIIEYDPFFSLEIPKEKIMIIENLYDVLHDNPDLPKIKIAIDQIGVNQNRYIGIEGNPLSILIDHIIPPVSHNDNDKLMSPFIDRNLLAFQELKSIGTPSGFNITINKIPSLTKKILDDEMNSTNGYDCTLL
jgi:hypothetical protein